MGARVYSGFGDLDRTEDPVAYVRKLESTGARPIWQAIKNRMLALLQLRPGDRVLDVGCGIGTDTLAMAELVGETGQVVGIDRSQVMLREARVRAARSPGIPTYFQVDAEELCFAHQSFDACRCERVLQHLPRPECAIAEMLRVARPGARIAVAEPDYGAVTIRGGDPETTRRLIAFRCSHFRSGKIGREVSRTLSRLGLRDCRVTVFRDEQTKLFDWYLESLRKIYVAPARSAGVVGQEDGERWLSDLRRAADLGQFAHTTPIFLASGRNP